MLRTASGLEDRLQQIIRLYAAENAQLPGSQTPATPYNFGAVFARLRGAVPPGTAVGQLTKKQFLANVVSELGVYVPKDYALHLWQRYVGIRWCVLPRTRLFLGVLFPLGLCPSLDSNGDGSVALEEFEDFVNANMVEVAAKVCPPACVCVCVNVTECGRWNGSEVCAHVEFGGCVCCPSEA